MIKANMITAEKLSKRFGSNVAVDLLSFSIGRGETFGLLGPNGAGKTTTISMPVGLLQPDQGTIQIQSDSVYGPPVDHKVRRLIGIAPQSVSLYEDTLLVVVVMLIPAIDSALENF